MTALNAIDIDKVPAPVLNAIIDHHKVERVLLFETEEQANKVIFGSLASQHLNGMVADGTKLSGGRAQQTVANYSHKSVHFRVFYCVITITFWLFA